MTEQHLQEWIKHPEHLNEESLQELKELVGRYPYFQTARVLYLKNLFVLKDPSFQEELRRSAIYIADLSLLFYFIEGERFTIRKHAPQETRSGQGESDRTLDLIDRFLAELPEEPAQELPLPAEVSVDYTSILLDRMGPEGRGTGRGSVLDAAMANAEQRMTSHILSNSLYL